MLGARGKFQWARFSPHPVRVLLCAYGKGSFLEPGPFLVSQSTLGCCLFVFSAVLRGGKVTTGRFGEQDQVYGEQHKENTEIGEHHLKIKWLPLTFWGTRPPKQPRVRAICSPYPAAVGFFQLNLGTEQGTAHKFVMALMPCWDGDLIVLLG